MVRIRSPIVFVVIVALLTMGLGAPRAFAACGDSTLPGGSLDPCEIPKYVIPLVIPPVMNNDGTGANNYDIAVRQFKQQILPGGIWNTLNGREDNFSATHVWSYGPEDDPVPDSKALGGAAATAPAANSQFNYPAYTIESDSGTQVNVRWINDLVDKNGNYLPHLLPIDQTVHWANPPMECRMGESRTDCAGTNPKAYTGPVPIVTHLHGARVGPESDGYPEAWWLPAANNIPAGYATSGTLFDDVSGTNLGDLGYADYSYPNAQPATTLWYHDHSLGMTRSNVYAGPAGFWLIRNGANDGGTVGVGGAPAVLPGPAPAAGESVATVNFPSDFDIPGEREKYREIPIVIQDRSFDMNGKQLFYPKHRAFFEGVAPKDLKIKFAPETDVLPIWQPEAFFNVMVVNGVSWPFHEVGKSLYRFRFLNGCNSRFLWLKFDNPDVKVWQIGAEQGFLPAPLYLNNLNLDGGVNDHTAQIILALAERADVIVDFRWVDDGTEVKLLNIGPDEPFGGGIPVDDFDPADPDTTGQVMKFVVNDDLTEFPGSTDGTATDPEDLVLNAEVDTLVSTNTRQVSLNERESEVVCVLADENTGDFIVPIKNVACNLPANKIPEGTEVVPFGPTEALLGVLDEGNPVPLKWTDDSGTDFDFTLNNGREVTVNVTENPMLGTTETWEMYNFTADAHPIHLHLVRFKVVNREGLEMVGDEIKLPATPDGNERGPEPWESGFKDTVISYPGEITRIKAKFDIEGLYVWHCHIVEHEDNEMMRPYVVSAAP